MALGCGRELAPWWEEVKQPLWTLQDFGAWEEGGSSETCPLPRPGMGDGAPVPGSSGPKRPSL